MSGQPPSAPPPGQPGGSGDQPWWAKGEDGSTPSWWQNQPGPPGAGPWQQQPPGQMPFASGSNPAFAGTYWNGPKTRAKGAVPALVCGLLSLVCCGIVLGPVAIYQGSQARYRVRTSNGRLSGDGMALLGMFLGGISVFLFFFQIWWYANHGWSATGTSSN
jgi:hypothetical protein